MTARPGGRRPNFFVLLGLDPAAPWDEPEFRRVLSAAQGQWSRDAKGISSLPRTAEAKVNINLVTQIKNVMQNPADRAREAEEAVQAQAAALARRRGNCANALDLMARRGHLLEEEAAKFRRDYADVLAWDAALAARLDALPVRPAGDAPRPPRLAASKEQQLREYLKAAGVLTLYEALRLADPGVTEQSPLPVLSRAADALYAMQHRKMNRQDPAIKALERLAGLAKELFRTEEERARLEVSTRLLKLHDLLEWFLATLGTAKAVDGAQVEYYLEQARLKGVADVDLALGYLLDELAKRQWTVVLPAREADDRLRRLVTCPSCAGLNEPAAEACHICGFRLSEPCPSCGRVEPAYGGCRCGFPTGQRDLVEALIVRASEALDASSPAEADAHLLQAGRIWRLPADSPDPVAVRLRAVQDRLTGAAEEIERRLGTIKALLAAKRFVTAVDELRAAPDRLPGRAEMLERAAAAVREARKTYAEALRAPSSARRVELLGEALRLCDDLEAARTELARLPPDPPGGARATVTDPAEGVLLTWERSTDPEVTYVVVRRDGTGAPESVEDLPGQPIVGEPAAPPWRDRSAVEAGGMPLTYAVFAKRFGTFSRPAVAPTVVAAPDAELRCEAGDGTVVVSWELPRRASRVAVTRQEVGGTGGPVPLPVTEPSRLVDGAVRNGVRYRYEARVAYPGAGGVLHWSAGRSVEVAPTRPPEPPGPLVLTRSRPQYGLYSERVDLRFPPPERGEVLIVRQYGAGSLRAGDLGPRGTLRLDGHVISGAPPLSDLFIDEVPDLLSYVPVLRLDGMDYVGAPRRYAARDEVTGLEGEFAGAAARLGWTWPAGGVRALVGSGTGAELVDVTAVGRPLAVARGPKEATGGCVLPMPAEAAGLHVIVALVVQRDGVDFVSAGVRRHLVRPRTRVEYEVRRAGGRRPGLALRTAGSADLPALVLRARPDRPPHTRADGDLVAVFAPLRVRGQHVVPVPKAVREDVHYRLFTAAPEAASTVELAPA